MTINFPTLIISRRPRHFGESWNDARSWFGGKPQLGEQAWPRAGARQTPFYFVAQIDLAEVAREVQRFGELTPLPDGALAFFIGVGDDGYDTGAVVHVPRSQLGNSTEPPEDAPAVLIPGRGIFPDTFDREAPRLFPYWPVEITAVEVEPVLESDPDDEDEEEQYEKESAALCVAVARHFFRRQYFLNADHVYGLLGGDAPRMFWWHSAQYYAAGLQRALHSLPQYIADRRRNLEAARIGLENLRSTGLLSASVFRSKEASEDVKRAEDYVVRLQTKLAELELLLPDFESFVQDVDDWARGKDPWQFMPPEAVEVLSSTIERGRKVFGEFTGSYAPRYLDPLETETLLALATADDRAYATMPEELRTLINTQYLLPSSNWHQMFGRGVDIQGNAAIENEGNVMLLQLVYDDMLHWDFGDMGAYQFWIPPDDLAKGNWAAVRLTFECG